jgi:hypothetical protein
MSATPSRQLPGPPRRPTAYLLAEFASATPDRRKCKRGPAPTRVSIRREPVGSEATRLTIADSARSMDLNVFTDLRLGPSDNANMPTLFTARPYSWSRSFA